MTDVTKSEARDIAAGGQPAVDVLNGDLQLDVLKDVTATAAELNKTDGQTVAGTTLNTGFLPLDITALREISTNDVQNLAAHGGLLASDSDPALARVNGATDKALRVTWDTANDTDEVQFPAIPVPSDLDASSDVTVHLMAKMGGTTDTPTIDVQAFKDEGDTEMGGATAALSDTLSRVTVTLSAADIAPSPSFLNIALVPGAHTTDALHLYAAWIEYTRS